MQEYCALFSIVHLVGNALVIGTDFDSPLQQFSKIACQTGSVAWRVPYRALRSLTDILFCYAPCPWSFHMLLDHFLPIVQQSLLLVQHVHCLSYLPAWMHQEYLHLQHLFVRRHHWYTTTSILQPTLVRSYLLCWYIYIEVYPLHILGILFDLRSFLETLSISIFFLSSIVSSFLIFGSSTSLECHSFNSSITIIVPTSHNILIPFLTECCVSIKWSSSSPDSCETVVYGMGEDWSSLSRSVVHIILQSFSICRHNIICVLSLNFIAHFCHLRFMYHQ